MRQILKTSFFIVLSAFLSSFVSYNLGFFNAFQDEKNVPYLCRVKNVQSAINTNYDEIYLIEGMLKSGEGHIIAEIKKGNQTKIIDETASSTPNNFSWYVKVKFFDFDKDRRSDFAFPCGFKIGKLKIGC
jgi:hypothetical protein